MKYKSLTNRLNQKAANKQLFVIKTRQIIVVNKHYNNLLGSFCMCVNEPFVPSKVEL